MQNPTEWIKDEERPFCQHCGKEFYFLRRRHHCRSCGDVFCSKCSPIHETFNERLCPSCTSAREDQEATAFTSDIEAAQAASLSLAASPGSPPLSPRTAAALERPPTTQPPPQYHHREPRPQLLQRRMPLPQR